MFLLRLAVCGAAHHWWRGLCLMHGVYKDWSQSACALQAVLDGNVSPVDHKHKHSTVNYEKIWVF